MTPRQIDALIAEHVMGIEDARMRLHTLGFKRLPHYSTNIAVAWEVLKKLGVCVMLEIDPEETRAYIGDVHVSDDTTPMAICLAALKAKGIKVWHLNK